MDLQSPTRFALWRSAGTADWHHPPRARRHACRTWKRPTDTRAGGHPNGRSHRHSQRPANRGNTIWRRRPPAVVTSHAPDHENATARPTTRWLSTTRPVRPPKMETYSVPGRPVLAALETRIPPIPPGKEEVAGTASKPQRRRCGPPEGGRRLSQRLAIRASSGRLWERGRLRPQSRVAIAKEGKRKNFLRPVKELILLVPAETAPESTPAPTEGNQEYPVARTWGSWARSVTSLPPNGCENCLVMNRQRTESPIIVLMISFLNYSFKVWIVLYGEPHLFRSNFSSLVTAQSSTF